MGARAAVGRGPQAHPHRQVRDAIVKGAVETPIWSFHFGRPVFRKYGQFFRRLQMPGTGESWSVLMCITRFCRRKDPSHALRSRLAQIWVTPPRSAEDLDLGWSPFSWMLDVSFINESPIRQQSTPSFRGSNRPTLWLVNLPMSGLITCACKSGIEYGIKQKVRTSSCVSSCIPPVCHVIRRLASSHLEDLVGPMLQFWQVREV